jgi:hypothetical protein
MRLSRSFRITVIVAACTAATAQAAFAGGEQKNMPPFTTPAAIDRTTAAATIPATAIAAAHAAIVAEPKNVLPFTRAFAADALERYLNRVSDVTSTAGSGEAKNRVPFTRPA